MAGASWSYGVDIRDAAAVEAMVEEIFREGPLTDLVNNAAGNFISRAPRTYPAQGFDAIANIVMHGTFYVTQAVGKRWIAAKQKGSVVSIARNVDAKRRAVRRAISDEQGGDPGDDDVARTANGDATASASTPSRRAKSRPKAEQAAHARR